MAGQERLLDTLRWRRTLEKAEEQEPKGVVPKAAPMLRLVFYPPLAGARCWTVWDLGGRELHVRRTRLAIRTPHGLEDVPLTGGRHLGNRGEAVHVWVSDRVARAGRLPGLIEEGRGLVPRFHEASGVVGIDGTERGAVWPDEAQPEGVMRLMWDERRHVGPEWERLTAWHTRLARELERLFEMNASLETVMEEG